MSRRGFVLAIDQGTTSTRAIAFDAEARLHAQAQVPLTQIYPTPGEVEHDPEELWQSVLAAARAVLKDVDAQSIEAIGITNQRETTVVWERATGKPLPGDRVADRAPPIYMSFQREWGPHVARTPGALIDLFLGDQALAFLLRHVSDWRRARSGEV
jgi:glycerol kinase